MENPKPNDSALKTRSLQKLFLRIVFGAYFVDSLYRLSLGTYLPRFYGVLVLVTIPPLGFLAVGYLLHNKKSPMLGIVFDSVLAAIAGSLVWEIFNSVAYKLMPQMVGSLRLSFITFVGALIVHVACLWYLKRTGRW